VPCPDVFVQDVPAAVLRRGLVFQDYFDPRCAAVIDAEHCVRLNYEAWFFADAAGRERFLADPLAYCGILTDPVSKRRFRPAAGAPSAESGGVRFYFECAETREQFEQSPEMYRLPRWSM
jgi:YHS domain-containing protein